MRNGYRLAIAMGVSLLSACGGGGGGGGGGLVVIPFQSFSAVQPGQTVEATGVSHTMAVTSDTAGNVTGVSVNPGNLSNSSARLTYGDGLVLTGLSITTPQSSPSWSGAEISCSTICVAENATSIGIAVNALDLGAGVSWNYQTYGYWVADGVPEIVGVMSIGAPTPVSGIPTTGTATYNGLSSGIFISQTGTPWQHSATMLAVADFGAPRSVAFSTTNTFISNAVSSTPMPELNLSGTLSITPFGANEILGTVTTASAGLSGPATGRFYGPTAQEIGGVYALTGTGVLSMIGGFGGKQ